MPSSCLRNSRKRVWIYLVLLSSSGLAGVIGFLVFTTKKPFPALGSRREFRKIGLWDEARLATAAPGPGEAQHGPKIAPAFLRIWDFLSCGSSRTSLAVRCWGRSICFRREILADRISHTATEQDPRKFVGYHGDGVQTCCTIIHKI